MRGRCTWIKLSRLFAEVGVADTGSPMGLPALSRSTVRIGWATKRGSRPLSRNSSRVESSKKGRSSFKASRTMTSARPKSAPSVISTIDALRSLRCLRAFAANALRAAAETLPLSSVATRSKRTVLKPVAITVVSVMKFSNCCIALRQRSNSRSLSLTP